MSWEISFLLLFITVISNSSTKFWKLQSLATIGTDE